MIVLTRLGGQSIAVNPDLITWVEVTPDTTVSLLGGDKLIVREALDDVIARVIDFRRAVISAIGESSAYPPSKHVLQGASWGRDDESPGRPGSTPPSTSIGSRR